MRLVAKLLHPLQALSTVAASNSSLRAVAMNSLYIVLQLALEIYGWIVIAYVVMGLLIAFGVVNAYNRAVNIIYEFLTRITEPALRPIRRLLPNLGQIDISPMILLLLLLLVRLLLAEYWPRGGTVITG